jgi:AraC-like DNA-binding protein
MQHLIPYICLLGLFLPVVILVYNKGFKRVNRYLSGFLFFASLYLLESFTFFFSDSRTIVALFTNTHAFFYLIGPLAFFYMRGTLRDNARITKMDLIHVIPFLVFLIGFIPYMVTPWDYKLRVAENIMSDNWDMSIFQLNKIIPHKTDQLLNVLHIYFYTISLWYLAWKYMGKRVNNAKTVIQNKLIRNWLLIFTSFMSIITLNFTYAMAHMWLFDNKSIFLEKASTALLIASIIYVAMNMVIMFFPHILYGLPIEVRQEDKNASSLLNQADNERVMGTTESEISIPAERSENLSPRLFSDEYVEKIHAQLSKIIEERTYLKTDFRLNSITEDTGLPAHHLTYFFNNILKVSFSEWRNNLRIDHAKALIEIGMGTSITLNGIAEMCGFTTQSTFIRAFRQKTGKTPGEFIKDKA